MIKLLTPESLINPYPLYNKIREENPVCEVDPGGIFLVSRFSDIQEGLNNHKLFSSRKKTELFSPSWLDKNLQRDFFMVKEDPPNYRSLRSAISEPFSRNQTNNLKPLMKNTAKTLTDKIQKKDNIEFLKDFAYPYIGTILGNLTGLENIQTIDETHEWIHTSEMSCSQSLSEENKQYINDVAKKQQQCFENIIKMKRSAPKDDFFSKLVYSTIEGVPLTTDQLINIIELIVRSGYQTSIHLIASAIVTLIRNKNALSKLQQNSSLTSVFIEEMLRLYSSAPIVIRHTTKETELHGVKIPKDATIWFCLAAGNRDPRVFQNPDNIQFDRNNKEHIAFGYGPHICLGIHLARTEIDISLKQLLPLIPSMSCPSDEDLKWLDIIAFRGLEELPITFTSPSS